MSKPAVKEFKQDMQSVTKTCPYCYQVYSQQTRLKQIGKRKSISMIATLKQKKEKGIKIGSARKFSPSDILKLRSEGFTIREIAGLLGCSTTPVTDAIKEGEK